MQKQKIDFDEMWTSVIKLIIYRIIFAYATANNWFIRQADVKTAFLNEEVEEEVFVTQLTDFKKRVKGTLLVCRLNKTLYKLKQSPRIWYKKAN